MKKLIKVIGILLASAFLLLPLKTYAAESVWSQDLDLTDSVSSSIAKVEDGVVVMQYEGGASTKSLLIKYDFDGNKIWEILKNYGYNMQEVSDGFIVWSETKITKFDKDGDVLWSKDIALEPTDANDHRSYIGAGLGRKLIELSDYYIVYQVHFIDRLRNDIFCIDKNGNIVQRISINDFLTKNNISSNDFWIMSIDILSDNKFVLVYKTDDDTSVVPLHIAEVTSDFVIIKDDECQYDLSSLYIRGVISTDKGYVVLGEKIVYYFLNDGNIKLYNKSILDVIKKDEYIYTYEFRGKNGEYMFYDTYIVKYNMDMEEQDVIKLPLSCGRRVSSSGLAHLKNRFILKDENNVVALNTPLFYQMNYDYQKPSVQPYSKNYEVESGSYSLARYRFAEEKDDVQEENKDSDSNLSEIINNIIKNPETNSIIIIVVFVVLTLVISIISYLLYMKKAKKKLIK